MEAVGAALDVAKDWAFPVSGLLLVLYPVAILVWTVVEGRLAAAAARRTSAWELPPSAAAKSPKSLEASRPPSEADARSETAGRCRGTLLPAALAAAALLTLAGAGAGFACLGGGAAADARLGAGPRGSVAGGAAPRPATPSGSGGAAPTSAAASAGGAGGAAAGAALLAGLAAAGLVVSARSHGGLLATAGSETTVSEAVPRYNPPPVNGVSLWHDVDLHVKSWLDEDTGLYRYVNEMPRGCLQKFEVQPHLPQNAVEEDPKGSGRLAAFGRPVPFNYGCFPQTFRDPDQKDELYGAPGDNDPLDVLDLATGVAGVGEVVRCRPLGAVCLIDEGEADWKILAVNVDSSEPLSEARSIEDVNRIAPGRIDECLQWIDDFKHSSGKDEATLDFKIHDMSTALRLIEEDHACWKQLLKQAGPDNMARGQHWVRPPRRFSVTQRLPHVQPPLSKLGWPSPTVAPRQPMRTPAPWPLVGASPAMAASRKSVMMRRQDRHASNPAGSSP